jgi:hypothetical protein
VYPAEIMTDPQADAPAPLDSSVSSSKSASFARYLGDGVYVDLELGRGVVLTTSNGMETTNTIYLDVDVVRAFRAWLRRTVDHERGDAE